MQRFAKVTIAEACRWTVGNASRPVQVSLDSLIEFQAPEINPALACPGREAISCSDPDALHA